MAKLTTMWSRSKVIDPANLHPSLAALVEAYDLEGGETVYTCQISPSSSHIEPMNIRPLLLSEADVRDIDRIY